MKIKKVEGYEPKYPMKNAAAKVGALAAAALITAGFAFLGVYMSNRKQAALVAYRLEKLEAKVDKHNHLVERMYRLESRIDTMEKNLKN